MIHKLARRISMLALFSALALPASARKAETGFLDRSVTVDGATYRYQVYVPANWTPQQRWPVLLFLHGYGERGESGLLQTDVGIGHAIRKSSAPMPFVVVMPQCQAGDHVWTEPAMQALAFAALDQSMKEFHGDRERVYLSGLSMGGYGTWDIVARRTGRFAAYIVICGGVKPNPRLSTLKSRVNDDPSVTDPYAETARRIGKTAVWIFHGAADPIVPAEESRKMAEALRAAGANFKYTEYPGVEHNSWDKAYAEPELFPWLLQQRLTR